VPASPIVIGMTNTTEELPTESPSEPEPEHQPMLVRPREGRIIAGVCAGIAKRWGVDLTLVRVLAVVLTVFSGVGLAAYIAIWLLTPSTDAPAPIRPGSRLGRMAARFPVLILIVVLALAIIAAGHAIWWGAPVGLLVVAGLVALLGFTRGGRWIVATFLLLVLVMAGTVAAFGSHFGTRTIQVNSVSDLHSEYNYGAGKVNLDLSGMQVTGQHRTTIHVGRGDVDVTLPPDTAVVVHARAGLGSVTVDGHKDSGIDAERTESIGYAAATATNQLDLNIIVGMGSVDVHN
jgi:phage shock protein PspC (stress-responsive transcriptional regulator)